MAVVGKGGSPTPNGRGMQYRKPGGQNRRVAAPATNAVASSEIVLLSRRTESLFTQSLFLRRFQNKMRAHLKWPDDPAGVSYNDTARYM